VELTREMPDDDATHVPTGEEPAHRLLTQLALVVCVTTRLLELGFYGDRACPLLSWNS
jgi:hypothetical protein